MRFSLLHCIDVLSSLSSSHLLYIKILNSWQDLSITQLVSMTMTPKINYSVCSLTTVLCVCVYVCVILLCFCLLCTPITTISLLYYVLWFVCSYCTFECVHVYVCEKMNHFQGFDYRLIVTPVNSSAEKWIGGRGWDCLCVCLYVCVLR